MNHCENATKIREATLLRENVVNSLRFATFPLKSTSNPLRITVKTRRKLSEYSQRDSVMGAWVETYVAVANDAVETASTWQMRYTRDHYRFLLFHWKKLLYLHNSNRLVKSGVRRSILFITREMIHYLPCNTIW